MKKNLAKKVTLSILAGAVLMSSSVVWAEDLVDNGKVFWEDKDIYYLRNETNNHDGNVPVGNHTKSFFGAYDRDSNDVTGGKVTISGERITISGDVYGGKSTNGGATKNSVIINDVSNITYGVYGGYSASGNVIENTVTINGGTVGDKVCGGYALNSGNSGASATDNTVTISGGTISGDETEKVLVRGGWSSANGDATSNEVIISGNGNVEYADVCGGYSYGGDVTGNEVIISGNGNVECANIYGGSTVASDVVGKAEGNTVTISSNCKVIDTNVYGGYSNYGTDNATCNTVNISGNTYLKGTSLYGGYVINNPCYGGASAPNTLNIGWDGEKAAAWTGANAGKVKSIAGFDVINFYGVQWDEVNPHITVDDIELKDTKINAYVSGEQTDVSSKKMTLIDATTLTMANGATNYLHNDSKVTLYDGVASIYTGVVEVDETNKDVVIKLEEKSNPNPNPGGGTPTPERNNQVLVLGESRAAAVAFTNQGSELIELGLNALARDNSKDTKVFAAVYGNHSEYETGSHVNVNGWSGIVGIGKTNANGLTVGAFFENGEGNYSTHNDYNAQYIRGDGEANYNGGGLLVRKDNANGVYAEASLRAGNLQNELRNAVRNGQDLTGYDVDTFYYGAHIGIGKVIPRGADGDSLDVYGKFIYTHHDGETFDVGGTPTKFDSVESERLRLGFRLNEVQTNKLNMYYGAAWEYEFNGDAHDKIASFYLETPSLEGSTVIGEVGAHYKASEKWSLDLNARAYVGQREGFSGSVQANYSF